MLRSFQVAALIGSLAISSAALAEDTRNGYASAVTDPAVVSTVTARFEQDFKTLGIQATVNSCRLMAQVAVGSRNSDTAYGAACRVTFGSAKPTEVLLCDDTFGESFAMWRSSFVDTTEWMTEFVRKNCF